MGKKQPGLYPLIFESYIIIFSSSLPAVPVQLFEITSGMDGAGAVIQCGDLRGGVLVSVLFLSPGERQRMDG